MLSVKKFQLYLLTSLSKPEARESGMQAGADAFLVKSQFDQEQLLQLIHQMVQGRTW